MLTLKASGSNIADRAANALAADATDSFQINIVASFNVTETGGGTVVSETETLDTFTVVLGERPGSDVVLALASGDSTEATVSPTSLTFTSANWNVPRTVQVTGVNDILRDGNQSSTITVSVVDAQSDDAFDPLADKTVVVTTVDNDIPVVATPTSIDDPTGLIGRKCTCVRGHGRDRPIETPP